MSTEGTEPLAIIPDELVYTFPPIASFWRRLGAWAIDTILLGLLGQVIGWPLSSLWFSIGPYGRIIGLVIIFLYFGLSNSILCNGQTLGKRLLKIAVRDRINHPISITRSFFRIAILATPAILNNWALPLFEIVILHWLLIVLVFGVGGAILYTMIFNRQARQGLHDLICGTYVVQLPGKPIESFPQTNRIHWLVSSLLIGLALIGATVTSFIGSSIVEKTSLAPIYKLYQILQKDNRFFTVEVNDNTVYGGTEKKIHLLQVTVWYRGARPSDQVRDKIMNDIAKVILENAKNLEQYDLLRISITSAYDLGIATGHFTLSDGEPINIWRQRIGQR